MEVNGVAAVAFVVVVGHARVVRDRQRNPSAHRPGIVFSGGKQLEQGTRGGWVRLKMLRSLRSGM